MHLSYRNRNVAISLALALGAALLVTLYVKNHNNNNNVASNLGKEIVSVFVASSDIPANTPGSDLGGLVHPEQIPRSDVVPGAISNQTQVKGLVSTAPIYAGEMVTTRRFQPQANEGTRGQITGNSRVVQLPGDPNQLLVGTLQATTSTSSPTSTTSSSTFERRAPPGCSSRSTWSRRESSSGTCSSCGSPSLRPARASSAVRRTTRSCFP